MERRGHREATAGFRVRNGRQSKGAARGRQTRTSLQLEALESRRLLASVAQIPVPSGVHSGPDGFAAGPGNSLWFTEYDADKVAVVDGTTHAITEFQLPTNNAQPVSITEGPDGNMWFTESAPGLGKIGMINVTTDQITEIPLPDPYAIPYGITGGSPGSNEVWFTEEDSNDIGMLNISTGKVTEYPIPTLDSVPEGITLGPGGKVWFTENVGNQIGVLNPATGLISEFGGLSPNSGPAGIVAGSGGALWFTEYTGDRIGTIDSTTHAVAEYNVPTAGSQPDQIVSGPEGKFWFTEHAGNQIGSINPSTDKLSEIGIANAGSEPAGIAAGPNKTVWFAELHAGYLGVITTLHTVVTEAPTSSFNAGSTFSLSVQIEDDSGAVDTDYNGPVSISLAPGASSGSLTGSLTATAVDGVASFPGLSLSQAGSYAIQVSAAGTTGLPVALPAVTATASSTGSASGLPVTGGPAPPVIISEQVLSKGKGKHKTTVGFKLVFSAALDAAAAQNAGNYTLTQNTRRGREKAAKVIRVQAAYNSSADSVSLLVVGKPKFAQGGQLVVNGLSPTGIMSTAGVYLDGNDTGTPGHDAILVIKPNMKSITS